ncbi:MAG: hypothetical protein KAS71_17995 [Bacteroidales bacterium]|nr:hypothetical protein [Bacteroidales bacterium]
MKIKNSFYILFVLMIFSSCNNPDKSSVTSKTNNGFAVEMVEFIKTSDKPAFTGTGTNTWDRQIRERGYILYEDGLYRMWYTGYNPEIAREKYLGYATSTDGISWKRYSENPMFNKKWTEDMFVIKYDSSYYMYAEGENDVAHLLVSDDGLQWEEQGDLIIFTTKGEAIPGPYGTPTIWIEDGLWHLFYERNDEAIWLAVSKDKITWKNVQDEPVLKPGPETYDVAAVAADQIVQLDGNYYLFYHATTSHDWETSQAVWTSNVAMSTDLLHWVKYPGNPIVEGDHSSPILVFDGDKPSLYTMHPDVYRYSPK